MLTAFSGIKRALVKATKADHIDDNTAPLATWSFHDHRRSFASALGEAGVPETVADAVLNHRQAASRSGVLGVYQKSSRWPEQVKAMEHWGRLLAAALDGGAASNVVQISFRTG